MRRTWRCALDVQVVLSHALADGHGAGRRGRCAERPAILYRPVLQRSLSRVLLLSVLAQELVEVVVKAVGLLFVTLVLCFVL